MVEMLASLVIFSIIGVMAVPMAQTYRDRQTEVILKDRLSRIRQAIRSFARSEVPTKFDFDNPCAPPTGIPDIFADVDRDGVSGEDPAGDTSGNGVNDDDLDGNVDEDGGPYFPRTLAELVDRGYLGAPDLTDDLGKSVPAEDQFPRDPTHLELTVKNIKTWQALTVTRTLKFICPSSGLVREVQYTGIYDVRSTSAGLAVSGQPLNEF